MADRHAGHRALGSKARSAHTLMAPTAWPRVRLCTPQRAPSRLIEAAQSCNIVPELSAATHTQCTQRFATAHQQHLWHKAASAASQPMLSCLLQGTAYAALRSSQTPVQHLRQHLPRIHPMHPMVVKEPSNQPSPSQDGRRQCKVTPQHNHQGQAASSSRGVHQRLAGASGRTAPTTVRR